MRNHSCPRCGLGCPSRVPGVGSWDRPPPSPLAVPLPASSGMAFGMRHGPCSEEGGRQNCSCGQEGHCLNQNCCERKEPGLCSSGDDLQRSTSLRHRKEPWVLWHESRPGCPERPRASSHTALPNRDRHAPCKRCPPQPGKPRCAWMSGLLRVGSEQRPEGASCSPEGRGGWAELTCSPGHAKAPPAESCGLWASPDLEGANQGLPRAFLQTGIDSYQPRETPQVQNWQAWGSVCLLGPSRLLDEWGSLPPPWVAS